MDTGATGVHRLLVIGCDEGTGQVTLVEPDGTDIPGALVFDWVSGGERVYDRMAALTCIAVLMFPKQAVEPTTAPTPPAPIKHKRGANEITT